MYSVEGVAEATHNGDAIVVQTQGLMHGGWFGAGGGAGLVQGTAQARRKCTGWRRAERGGRGEELKID